MTQKTLNIIYVETPLYKKSLSMLVSAANKLNVNVEIIEPSKVDYTDLPKLTSNDLLYRISTDKKSRELETLIVNSKATTFNKQTYKYNLNDCALIAIKNTGTSTVPTIHDFTNDRKTLKHYVLQLGGYPIVVKVEGGKSGVGVMKIDSQESLFSIADYLVSTGDTISLKKYIDVKGQIRAIVIGDEVVASMMNGVADGDFRTNVGNKRESYKHAITEDESNMAIQATKAIGQNFGGVDILIDKDGGKYIAEVNSPCYFTGTQEITGIDIASIIIKFLLSKSNNRLDI